jgi:hypothetical protein
MSLPKRIIHNIIGKDLKSKNKNSKSEKYCNTYLFCEQMEDEEIEESKRLAENFKKSKKI